MDGTLKATVVEKKSRAPHWVNLPICAYIEDGWIGDGTDGEAKREGRFDRPVSLLSRFVGSRGGSLTRGTCQKYPEYSFERAFD